MRISCLASFGVVLAAAFSNSFAAEIGTAFTYQGVLENPPGNPLNDTCAFEFALCDDAVAACAPGTVSSHPAVAVTDGLFTVPDVDFGDDACNGEARWMAISVMCSGDAGFVALSPRVELKPAPYALRAVEGVGPPTGIHVTPDGDVGIGTNAPQAQLDVNGAARATTIEITGGQPLLPSVQAWGLGAGTVPSGIYTAVAGGHLYSFAIRSDGTLAAWGNNNYGQLNVPSGEYIGVAAGMNDGLAIRTDGTLAGWGNNEFGQTNVPPGTFTSVAAGYYHGLAIRSDGTLAAWGKNNRGQTNVPFGTFVAVAAGEEHSLAIRSDGTLAGWGSDAHGEIDVPFGTFSAVAAGEFFSLAIRSDGTLVGWGNNGFGLVDVPDGTFVSVAGGSSHALAVRSDGSLIAWGDNSYGQCNVPGGTFTSVVAGTMHSLALRADSGSGAALILHNDSAYKPGSNTWTIYSDRRLKKNITPLSGALDHLLQLRGVTFDWMDPASQGGITGTQMGLIADEVQRVFPQWVGRDPKGYQTLTVGGFEALTAEAMRELREEKDCEIQDLKSQISDLKEMVKKLTEDHETSKSPNVQKSK